jgi:dTDP-4-dehydrorhamnose reductase
MRMAAQGLSGVFHATSPKCASKYDFGVALARQFGLDDRLISPASISASDLKVVRSPRLTLCCDKLMQALGGPLPDWESGLRRFFELYQRGYPQVLHNMAC